jgi:hypothetical protein
MRPERIECHVARPKLAGMLALVVLMISGSMFCTTLPELVARLAGWFGVAFFGFCLVVISTDALRRGPVVVIDDRGIDYRRFGVGRIEWVDVSGLMYLGNSLLGIDVVDPEKYLARMPLWLRAMSRLNRACGYQPILVPFHTLRPGISEVREYLQAFDTQTLPEEPGHAEG